MDVIDERITYSADVFPTNLHCLYDVLMKQMPVFLEQLEQKFVYPGGATNAVNGDIAWHYTGFPNSEAAKLVQRQIIKIYRGVIAHDGILTILKPLHYTSQGDGGES